MTNSSEMQINVYMAFSDGSLPDLMSKDLLDQD